MPTTADRRVADSLRLTVFGQYRQLDPDLLFEAANLIDGLLDDVERLTTELTESRRAATTYTPLPHFDGGEYRSVETKRAAFTTTTEIADGVEV